MTSDDVKVGLLVAITRHRCDEPDCEASDCTGRPWRVVAVSLPFAVLEDCIDGQRCSIDLRRWELGRVDRKYVRALQVQPTVEGQDEDERPCDGEYQRCVRCGTKMVQVWRSVSRVWRWECPMCKAVGELVKS